MLAEEVVIIQEIFQDAIELCIDKDNLADRHISER